MHFASLVVKITTKNISPRKKYEKEYKIVVKFTTLFLEKNSEA